MERKSKDYKAVNELHAEQESRKSDSEGRVIQATVTVRRIA